MGYLSAKYLCRTCMNILCTKKQTESVDHLEKLNNYTENKEWEKHISIWHLRVAFDGSLIWASFCSDCCRFILRLCSLVLLIWERIELFTISFISSVITHFSVHRMIKREARTNSNSLYLVQTNTVRLTFDCSFFCEKKSIN